jgi:hypothetical protein
LFSPVVSLYWGTHDVKKAFENLVPPCQGIRNSLNRMEAEGKQDRIKEIEYQKTLKLLDLTNRKSR